MIPTEASSPELCAWSCKVTINTNTRSLATRVLKNIYKDIMAVTSAGAKNCGCRIASSFLRNEPASTNGRQSFDRYRKQSDRSADTYPKLVIVRFYIWLASVSKHGIIWYVHTWKEMERSTSLSSWFPLPTLVCQSLMDCVDFMIIRWYKLTQIAPNFFFDFCRFLLNGKKTHDGLCF